MYKLIKNSQIIDLLDKVIFGKYTGRGYYRQVLDSSIADVVYGSDKKTVYAIQGRTFPGSDKLLSVSIHKISTEDAEQLKHKIVSSTTYITDPEYLVALRTETISKLSADCSENIYSGIRLSLSDGYFYQFELTVEDQLNLNRLRRKIEDGAAQVLYHQKGRKLRWFSKEDILKVIHSADKHIEYHTNYFNLLKQYILTETDVDKISSITYGVNLKELGIDTSLLEGGH